jgi:hypothetical protein
MFDCMGKKFLFYASILFIIFQILNMPSITACKDIVACGDATEGDYNLLLKVRDPSRPGFQVLCMIPEDYEYAYHHPWTGQNMTFTSSHAYIGVASKDDIPPSIVKAGMTVTDAGLAFGDADSVSRWINPSPYAWDDFDWIRYACEQADTAEEAADMLTTEAVDKLHAPAVSENLFIVGADKGYLIEADAYRYHIKEIVNGYDVISNYPRQLWRTQYLRLLPISTSFDTEKQELITKGDIIRLNSLQGIRITNINDTGILVKQVPFFTFITYENGKPYPITEPIHISLGKRETVGDYSVTLLDIQGNTAIVHVETVQHAWQTKMETIIDQKYGSITVQDLMNWSRLNGSMLDGLRPMCETSFTYEGSAIYKIPKQYSNILSNGWFAANHAHSSIFVPFHVCNTDIFDPYETGDVAVLSSTLSKAYSNQLIPLITNVETVFLHENDRLERWAHERVDNIFDVSNVVTVSDVSMQKQAWTMLQIYDEIQKKPDPEQKSLLLSSFNDSYTMNYMSSLTHLKDVFFELGSIQGSDSLQDPLVQLTIDICGSIIEMCHAAEIPCPEAEQSFEQGITLLSIGQYEQGFEMLSSSYLSASDCFYG